MRIKTNRRLLQISGLLIFLLLNLFSPTSGQKGKIAIFGSSVAKGSGDTTGTGGYTGYIRDLMSSRGWTVVNVSKGGDNTMKILPRFESQLLPEKPKYVILGLSLGNEGIYSSSETTRNRIFERYRSGMQYLIRICRENGMYPVVANCYARNDFEPVHYDASKKMNLIINTWDVPSINLLGTIDDGNGKWLNGYFHDKSHPDNKGHKELFYAYVPSLFDAIDAGKKIPYKVRSKRYLSVTDDKSGSALSYVPDDTIHSFALSFLFRTDDAGTIATIKDSKGSSAVILSEGKVVYRSQTDKELSSVYQTGDQKWQYVVLSHQYASGKTSLFVNGELADTLIEKILLQEIVIGGNWKNGMYPDSPSKASYRDVLIFRSALNIDEAKALFYDQLLQSSLEIYAPLNDEKFIEGKEVINNAQSFSKLVVKGRSMISMEDK